MLFVFVNCTEGIYELPSDTAVKRSLRPWQIASSNLGEVAATCDRELRRAKCACALRQGGGAYSLLSLSTLDAMGICELMRMEGSRWCVTLPPDSV